MNFSLRALCALVILAGGLHADDKSQWSSVEALPTGKNIGVVYEKGKRAEGTLEQVTADSITVKTQSTAVKVAKGDVARVYRRSGLSRTNRILIGAGIGLAVGITIDQTLGTRLRNEGSATDDAVRAATVAGSAAAGAAIGALSGGYETVYQKTK